MADGNRATIPANMIKEIPLPMPRSVICSPNHMIKAVPEVRVTIVIKRKRQPGSSTIASPPGPLKSDSDHHPLNNREDNRAIAGILGNFTATHLTLFRKPLEIREHTVR